MPRRHLLITSLLLTALGGLFAALFFAWPTIRGLAAPEPGPAGLAILPPAVSPQTEEPSRPEPQKEARSEDASPIYASSGYDGTKAERKPRSFSEKVPVLMYHYISLPPATTTLPGLYLPPQTFAKQLAGLKEGKYQSVFLSELAASLRTEKALPDKSIALTFDDGYEDFYTQAFPLLKEYGFKGTLYVIINRLDTPGYLTKGQVKELAASGLVEIGSHTFNHPDLRSAKEKASIFEIKDSRRILEDISGQPVDTFAYPFGYYNDLDQAIASSSRYSGAVSVHPGVWQSTSDIWLIKRLRPGAREGQEFSKWLAQWLE
jgi:peptidoglycan/xylan/chitin deacetylase (PgdA/CDA1 family)